MNFEDWKNQWAAYDKKLETSMRLNLKLLRESSSHKAKSTLRRMSFFIGVELVIDLAAVIVLGMFIANHVREPAFLATAIALDALAIFHVAFGIYQLVVLAGLDFSAPVMVIQKKLATLRIRRIRATLWTFLLSPLLWILWLIVVFKGVTGVNPYTTFPASWLIANVLLGVAVIPLMLWVSKRFAHRFQKSPLIQRIMDDIAGRSLSEATSFMDELSNFERDAGSE